MDLMNLTINITETGVHRINYSCPHCFNISECPLPVTQFYSNYQANWIFLAFLLCVVTFLMYRFYEKPFKAFFIALVAEVVLCFIGGYFGWISGLPMVIIAIVLALVTMWRFKEELML